MNSVLLVSAVLLPILLGLVLLRWDGLRFLAPWAVLPALMAVFAVPDHSVTLSWMLQGACWGLDGTGRMFLLFTTLVWLAAGWYARGYITRESRWFFVFFLLTLGGNIGVVLAQDVMSFYLFFSLMSFASYGLIVHSRSAEAWRAGRIYIVLVVLGEVMLFTALVMLVSASGSPGFGAIGDAFADVPHQNTLMALLIGGLGIKAGVFGLHLWLPLAHPVAPTPASAVLSGAMIKAGLLGWLRLFPLGSTALPEWGAVLIVLGLVTAFYGVLIGLTQREPKVVLAYSSISQMGVMTIAVGGGLVAPAAWPALLAAVSLYALHHGLAKGALFLGVGLAGGAPGVQRLWIGVGLLLPALSLAGAPFTSGMLAKDLLKSAWMLDSPWHVVTALLPWSALATTLLMLRFLYVVWLRPSQSAAHVQPGSMWVSWLLLVAATAVLARLMLPMEAQPVSLNKLFDALWPMVAALVLAAFALRARLAPPALPAGDILLPLERAANALGRVIARLSLQQLPDLQSRLVEHKPDWQQWTRRLNSAENLLCRWPMASGLFVLLAVVAFVAVLP